MGFCNSTSSPCSWQRHPQVRTLFQVLSWVRDTRPCGGCFENVAGLASESPGECSALSVILTELQDMNYSASAVHSNLGQFHPLTRHRISPSCPFSEHVAPMSQETKLGLSSTKPTDIRDMMSLYPLKERVTNKNCVASCQSHHSAQTLQDLHHVLRQCFGWPEEGVGCGVPA